MPRTALTEEQGIFFVYLQLDEEGYKKQEVNLGADNGKSVQILTLSLIHILHPANLWKLTTTTAV